MSEIKELTEMMKGLIAEVRSVKEELASFKTGKTPEKTEKPVKEKEDKSIAGYYGKFLVNEDGTGKTIKHVAVIAKKIQLEKKLIGNKLSTKQNIKVSLLS